MNPSTLAKQFQETLERNAQVRPVNTSAQLAAANHIALMQSIVAAATVTNTTPSRVADALTAAKNADVARDMVTEGKASLEQAYGQSLSSIAAQVQVRLEPVSPANMQRMVQHGAAMANTIVSERYAQRGVVQYQIDYRNDAVQAYPDKAVDVKERLVEQVLMIHAAVDHQAKVGMIREGDAPDLKKNLDTKLFHGISANKPEFQDFQRFALRQLREDVLQEVSVRQAAVAPAINAAYNNPSFQAATKPTAPKINIPEWSSDSMSQGQEARSAALAQQSNDEDPTNVKGLLASISDGIKEFGGWLRSIEPTPEKQKPVKQNENRLEI